MSDNGSFIVIQNFMRDLGLKGNELLIYAIIYGFSQDGESYFHGSLKYLSEWTGSTERTVQNCLDKLCERGLVEKVSRSGKNSLFRAVAPAPQSADSDGTPEKNSDTPEKISGVPLKNFHTTPEKISGDNIDDSIVDNNIIYNTRTRDKKSVRHKYGTYGNVLMTDAEIQKLKSEFPNDWEERIRRVDDYCEMHGKKYKNYFAVIKNWARHDNQRGQPASPNLQTANRPEYDDSVLTRLLAKGGMDA